MDIRENLKKIKENKIIFALSLNVIILLVMVLFFYARYNCELDISMQAMLYGTFSGGDYMSHLIFSNIILGGILSTLMEIFPMTAWYTVFHYAMAFIGITIIVYVIIDYSNNLTGKTNKVESKIKPKFNITRSYCEKLNSK